MSTAADAGTTAPAGHVDMLDDVQYARVRIAMYGAGAASCIVALVAPHGAAYHAWPIAVMGVFCLLTMTSVIVDPQPRSLGYYRVAILLAVVLQATMVWGLGEYGPVFSAGMISSGITAVMILSRRQAMAVAGFIVLTYCVAILAVPDQGADLLRTVLPSIGIATVLGISDFLLRTIRNLAEENATTAQENARLAQEAEAAAAAKGSFLATMSHEIRTPMNAVIGMTELLLRTELDRDQRELAETVSNSGEVLLTLINEVLDFSKIEAGELHLELRPHVLRDWVESGVDLVATLATRKGLELVTLIDPDVPPAIVGDDTRLRQILINLVSNAIKFTAEGEIIVDVGARALDGRPDGAPEGDGPWHEIHMTVTDTGVGIAPDRLEAVFESFSQADSSTTRQFGGTGLGLTISQRLVEMMGGRIWVESELGVGSTFHVVFPARATAMPEPDRAPDAGVMRGLDVLIVDDTPANCELLRRLTSAWDMRPVIAESAAAALELLDRGRRFDVALLDMMMPDVDGLTLARKIRQRSGEDGPTMLLLSSMSHRPTGEDAHLFAAMMTKPLKASQLFDTMIGVLDGDRETLRMTDDVELAVPAGLRVLLAEDNAINQKLAVRVLQGFGLEAPVIAGNGQEALDALAREPFDVVLMDIEMPVMDGLEAMRRIVADHGEQRPRLVAMTANAFVADREACFEAGADDYVSKPIRIPALAEALTKCTPTAVGKLVPVLAGGAPEADAPDETPVPLVEPQAETGSVQLDAEALERLMGTVGGDGEFAAELITDFIQARPSVATLLESADVDLVRRTAHTLKSGAATFGAMELSALAGELEEAASTGGDIADLPARIATAFERVEPALIHQAKAYTA